MAKNIAKKFFIYLIYFLLCYFTVKYVLWLSGLYKFHAISGGGRFLKNIFLKLSLFTEGAGLEIMAFKF